MLYFFSMWKLPKLKNSLGVFSGNLSKAQILNAQSESSNQTEYLSVDIGTEYLKVLRFGMDDSQVTVKDVSIVQQQEKAMNKGVIRDLGMVLDNVRLAVHEVVGSNDYSAIGGMVLGLAGEYIQGVSIIVNYDRVGDVDKVITKKEQDNLIRKIHDQILQSGKEDLSSRTGLSIEDIEILHVTLTGIQVGGINVEKMEGYAGKDVRLVFYASFAPKTYVEALRTLADELGIPIMGIVAQPFAVARAFDGARQPDFSAIFVDIGGGTTDVAVVDNGSVMDTQMFAFGGRVFTKEIARRMNIDYRHAELRKLKFAEGKVVKKVQRELSTIVTEVTNIWLNLLQSALEEVQDVDILPDTIYLCGGGASLPNIRKQILEYPWKRLLPFVNIPKVHYFTTSQLRNVVDESGKLDSIFFITPAALAIYLYDKMYSPDIHNRDNL